MVSEDRGNSGGSSAMLGLLAENGQSIKKLRDHLVKVPNDDANPCDVNPAVSSGDVNPAGSSGDANPAGSSGDVFRTYQRRKRTKVDADKDPGHLAGQSTDKSKNEPLDSTLRKGMQDGVAHVTPCGLMNTSIYQLFGNRKGTILEQMFQSLEMDGGLKECILHALASHSEADRVVETKESGKCCEVGNRCSGPSQFLSQGSHNETKAASNGSLDKPKSYTVKELCQQMFLDVCRSENFAQLCSMVSENFEGMNVGKFFDIGLIDSRMKDGSYEGSPLLLHSDFQRMWTKLHEVGSEMVALSRSLQEISSASFRAQVSGSVHENTGDGKDELAAKMEQAEIRGVNKACACGCCGEKAEGRDSLVCDSCEEIYHVSCVEPTVKEIPLRSWFCAKCTAKGMESAHGNCVVCERLNASRSFIIEDEVEELITEDIEESSNGLVDGGVKDLAHCNVCRTEVRSDENFRVCGHSFCPHKYYHEKCLTRKQLDSHGSCWYCPSCLCRACLVDFDDDKIVLCDSCDHAYHIFCMQPPRTSIPRGKWFCRKCNGQIQSIRKAKRTYETLENELKRQGEPCVGGLGLPKGKDESGGVDMLLNAAKTLNYQEDFGFFGSDDQ